jgi:hypothetical protein
MMDTHSALTSHDLQVLFAAAEADGTVNIVIRPVAEVQVAGQALPKATPEGLQRLLACGYLEGGPDVFRLTPAGREYADSMK